mgnify:FL=1
MLSINSKAPDIKLKTDQDFFSLKDHNDKNLVVFFFPKADTSGCTAEAADFSKLKQEFDNQETLVIGISKDSPEKQKKFKEKHDLNCILGSDNETNICEKYGVWVEKSMYGRKYMGIQRTTFLVNKEGKIKFIWSKVKVNGHAEEVLKKVKELN